MQQFTLPNLKYVNTAYSTYNFNKKSYNFRFEWCESFVIVDIYTIKNGVTTYIIQGFPVTVGYNLTERVKDTNIINGQVAIQHKHGKDIEITRENFNTDFVLVYESEK